MSTIDHIILYITLFCTSFVWSKVSLKNKKTLGIIFAIIYIFVVGSRTWGPDYEWYKYKFNHPNNLVVQEDELGFQWLNNIIRFVVINGDFAFYIYALILMWGVLSVINNYKKNWQYMCLFVVPAMMLETSIHIRQGIAFAFALFAFSYINKNDVKKFILFAFIAFNIHKVIIVLFIIYFIVFFLSKKKIPIYLIAIAYTIATFVPQVFNIDSFTKNVELIQIGGKYDGYIDNANTLFSNDANRSNWQQSPAALIISYLCELSMFVIIDIALKKKEYREMRIYYYMFVIGAIFIRFFFLNELLRRTFTLPYMLYFIPLGYALSFISYNKINLSHKNRVIYIICLNLVIIYMFLYYGRFIFLNENCGLLWNIS